MVIFDDLFKKWNLLLLANKFNDNFVHFFQLPLFTYVRIRLIARLEISLTIVNL